MSASERLRERAVFIDTGYHMYEPDPLLPLIADVVEAAERVAAIPQGGLGALDRLSTPEELQPSLTALSDALEEK